MNNLIECKFHSQGTVRRGGAAGGWVRQQMEDMGGVSREKRKASYDALEKVVLKIMFMV